MNTITLQNLRLESFKGIHNFEAAFDGQDARICAENGIGKTTLYDAWLWLAFGKDSTGRKEFEVRPLGLDNRPLKGLVVMVEAMIAVGASCEMHTLRKEQHEKVDKYGKVTYPKSCWVNEVPKKEGEYKEFIDSLIPEETFKMLADLSYFNVKLHHTERRKMLLVLAGKVAQPQGFENLLAVLNGRSVKDYEKVLKDQKERHVKECDEINPRLDEINRGLTGYVQQDTADIETKRGNLFLTIADLDEQRRQLLGDEKARQGRIDALNHLTAQRLHRESVVRAEQNPSQPFRDEKQRIDNALAEQEEALNSLHRQIRSIDASIESAKVDLARTQTDLDRARKDVDAVEKEKSASTCYACGQELPKAKLRANEQKKQAERRQRGELAERLKADVDNRSTEIADLQQQKKALGDKAAGLYEAFQKACDAGHKRIAGIDAAIASRPEADMTKDAEWQNLGEQIQKAQGEIGAPVAEQLDAIEGRKTQAQQELDKVNAALAQADRAKADKARIAELEAKEKDLAQKIADVDRQLAECADYRAVESRLIETAVNGRFTHVQFKLFNYNLNGSIEDTCEAMLNGVPYADLSTGQQILAGVDVINVLSEHYGLSVPLWVDHSESLTLPLEAKSQVIELYAQKGVHELTIEVAEKAVAA
jgi:hypothetical protein